MVAITSVLCSNLPVCTDQAPCPPPARVANSLAAMAPLPSLVILVPALVSLLMSLHAAAVSDSILTVYSSPAVGTCNATVNTDTEEYYFMSAGDSSETDCCERCNVQTTVVHPSEKHLRYFHLLPQPQLHIYRMFCLLVLRLPGTLCYLLSLFFYAVVRPIVCLTRHLQADAQCRFATLVRLTTHSWMVLFCARVIAFLVGYGCGCDIACARRISLATTRFTYLCTCTCTQANNNVCYLKNRTTMTRRPKAGVTLILPAGRPAPPPRPPSPPSPPGPSPPPVPPLPSPKYAVKIESHSSTPVLSHSNAKGHGASPCRKH